MLAGETSANNAASGFITAEQITLGTSPTGTVYSWGIAKPSGSTARGNLSDDDVAAPVFTPDIAGVWCLTCTVDGTPYTLRLTVTQLAESTALDALRLSPVADSAVPAPALGAVIYYSSTQDALVTKEPDGDVIPVQANTLDFAYSYRLQGTAPTVPTTIDTWHAIDFDATPVYAGSSWSEANGILTSVGLVGLYRLECYATFSAAGATGAVQLYIDVNDALRATSDPALNAGLALVSAATPGGNQICVSRIAEIGDGSVLRPIIRHNNAAATFTVERLVLSVHPI